MADYQRFDVRTTGAVTIVDINEKELSELDHQELLREELMSLVEATSPKQLILSLKRVEFMGSNAIGILVDVRKAVHNGGGQVILSDLQTNVRMSFKVLNLEGTLFKICNTESEALNAFA